MNVSGSGVRLRYTSLVLFFSRFFSILTGVLFVLLITRKLPIEQYGLWRMINNYIGYTLVLVDVYCYWLPRTMARGINTSKTGLVFSLMLGSVATVIYVVIAFWFSIAFDQPFLLLLIAALQVILCYIQFAVESISSGYAPQFIGYARIVLELIKTGMAFLLVFFFRVELLGAIIAVIGAQIVAIFFLIALNLKVLTSSRIDFNLAKSWLRSSWLPIFNTSVGMIVGLDVLIIRLISGSEYPIAYYGVALTMAGVVANANAVTSALYPRLLAKASKYEVEVTIRLMYMVAIPMSIFMFFYAEPISAVYGLKYLVAINTIKVAIIASLLFTLSPLLDTIILGFESKDAEKLTFKDIVDSMLFKLPLLNCLIYAVHLTIVYALQINGQDFVEASFRWIISTIITNVLALAVKIIVVRRGKIGVSTKTITSIIRYFTVSLLVTFTSFNIWKIAPAERIMDLLLSLVPPILFTLIGYSMLLAIFDREFRELLRETFKRTVSSLKRG